MTHWRRHSSPAPLFSGTGHAETRDLKQLHSIFCITETNAALRIGEVTGEPWPWWRCTAYALEAKFELADEPEIRRHGNVARPNHRRTRLQDDARRVAPFARYKP